jgi:bifunctional DNA-binding transcriptional regulator/antitoxin component of YhaV-PrlF toxin-antitoxin module
MIPKLTDEQRAALSIHPGTAVEVEDEQTRRIYVLVAKDDFRQLVDGSLRRELQIGFDQADAGDVAEWDVEEILAEARRRHASRAS